MICPYCIKGVPIARAGEPVMPYPCEACGGTTVAHCCDGVRAQPDERDERLVRERKRR